MRVIRTLCAALVAISLAGCATQFGQRVEKVVLVITGATVDPQAVIIASNAFDALERTATNYLSLRKCSDTSGVVCRSPRATKVIIPAVRSGRAARDELQEFLKTHPGQLGAKGLYDSLQSAIDTLQSVFQQYNVGAG